MRKREADGEWRKSREKKERRYFVCGRGRVQDRDRLREHAWKLKRQNNDLNVCEAV